MVSIRHCEGFAGQGYRSIYCVQPHMLRQAGGSAMIELDQVPAQTALRLHVRHASEGMPSLRQALPQRLRAQVQLMFYNIERQDCYRR